LRDQTEIGSRRVPSTRCNTLRERYRSLKSGFERNRCAREPRTDVRRSIEKQTTAWSWWPRRYPARTGRIRPGRVDCKRRDPRGNRGSIAADRRRRRRQHRDELGALAKKKGPPIEGPSIVNRGPDRPQTIAMRKSPQRRQSSYLTADEDNETLDHLLSLRCRRQM